VLSPGIGRAVDRTFLSPVSVYFAAGPHTFAPRRLSDLSATESLRRMALSLFEPLSLLHPEFGLLGHPPHYRRRAAAGHSFGRASLTEHADDGYKIEIEAPGLGKEHVDVKLTDNTLLRVSGVKYAERPAQVAEPAPESSDDAAAPTDGAADEAEPRTVLRSFERQFRLPRDADVNRIGGSVEHGLITITIPKAPEPAPVSIALN